MQLQKFPPAIAETFQANLNKKGLDTCPFSYWDNDEKLCYCLVRPVGDDCFSICLCQSRCNIYKTLLAVNKQARKDERALLTICPMEPKKGPEEEEMKPKQPSVETRRWVLPGLQSPDDKPIDVTQQMQNAFESGCMQCVHRGEYGRCLACMRVENGVMKFTKFERATTPTNVV